VEPLIWLDSLVGCLTRPLYCWFGFVINGGLLLMVATLTKIWRQWRVLACDKFEGLTYTSCYLPDMDSKIFKSLNKVQP
jgi:hypothetical protein